MIDDYLVIPDPNFVSNPDALRRTFSRRWPYTGFPKAQEALLLSNPVCQDVDAWSIVEHPAQIRQAYLEHRTSACFMPLSLISMSSLRFWRLLKGRFGQCVVGEESQQRGRTHQPCCKHTFMMHGLLLRHVMTVIGWVSSIMIHQSLLS